ncbi:MAG: 3-carboxy-cis,cis-muconate cycloisomerase, partial [Actinophytocola sp.]|nr:3-carboxy-cis,cis-muconate cycloisomerase [Actinophytocola sp.]
MSDAGLFDGVFAAGPIREVISDAAWLQAMLDFEAALAHAQADVGLIPHRHATAISAQCRAEFYDAREIGAAAVNIGNPAGPLVRALTARVAGEAAGYVHFGATSQDVMDTAAMLLARRAVDVVAADVTACADLLAELAEQHVDTVQAGRTLLQHALPVTFGLTAAGWLSGMDAAAELLATQRGTFSVQLGGAAGTLASLGEHGPDVLSGIAARLGLAEPALPWHAERSRIASLAATLGTVSGTVAKIARDIVLLAQTEVAEVAEVPEITEGNTAGGSSTMPHKRNPVAAVSAAAAAAQAPGLVATVLSASAHEHQRAAGNWHAEWQPLTGLLRGTGAAARWLRTSLQRLHVDPVRMRTNLELTGGLLLAERVTSELVTAHGVGRAEAHDAV